jgi:hypothetical protein
MQWLSAGRDDSVLKQETRDYYKAVKAHMGDPSAVLPSLSAADWERYENKVKVNNAAFNQDFNDHLGYITAGNDVSGAYVAELAELRQRMSENLEPDALIEAEEKLARALDFNSKTAVIRTGTEEEAADTLTEIHKELAGGGAEDYRERERYKEAADNALQYRIKGIASDPGGYAATEFPEVRDALEAWKSLQDQDADEETLREAMNNYASLAIDRLSHLSGQPWKGAFLPQAHAAQLAATINNSETHQKGLASLYAMSEAWGPYWSRVQGQIVGMTDPMVMVLPAANPIAAEKLISYADVSEKDLLDSLGDWEEAGIQSGSQTSGKTAWEKQVTVAMSDFNHSIPPGGDNMGVGTAFKNGVRKLSLIYMKDMGLNLEEAVERAKQDVLDASYTYHDVPGTDGYLWNHPSFGTNKLRIPHLIELNGREESSAEVIDTIFNGMDSVFNKMQSGEIDTYIAERISHDIESDRALWLDSLGTDRKAFTSWDEGGIVFYEPGVNNYAALRQINEDGTAGDPIMFTWQELFDMGGGRKHIEMLDPSKIKGVVR